MNEVYQLVNATLVTVFAAVMIVVGHLYIENRTQKLPPIPAVKMFSMQTSPL
jgi:hypothetical protein